MANYGSISSALDTISSALDFLCNVSSEEVQPHSNKVLLVFQKFQKLPINNRPSASHDYYESTPPPSDDNGTLMSFSSRYDTPLHLAARQLSSDRHDVTPHPPESNYPPSHECKISLPPHAVLLDKLQRQHQKIEEFLNQEEREMITRKRAWQDEDSRVRDILICDGSSKPTPQDKFLKALGQRSLAREFGEWELAKYETSRVQELVRSPAASNGNGGHVKEFVRLKQEFHDKGTAERGIQHGIKLLVAEAYLAIEARAEIVGISALLAFTFRELWHLKYSGVSDFVLLVCCCQDTTTLDLARRISARFNECQSLYDEERTGDDCRRKRRRLDAAARESIPTPANGWDGLLAAAQTAASSNAENVQPIRQEAGSTTFDACRPLALGSEPQNILSEEHSALEVPSLPPAISQRTLEEMNDQFYFNIPSVPTQNFAEIDFATIDGSQLYFHAPSVPQPTFGDLNAPPVPQQSLYVDPPQASLHMLGPFSQ